MAGAFIQASEGYGKDLREGWMGIAQIKEKGKGIPDGRASLNKSLVEKKKIHFWRFANLIVIRM